ncbi:MAG: phosphoglycerate kinase [Dehalococcoidia bacterium]|nr:phosphoglycerate kinase [Dehalococcoidia bacterium]
MPKKTVEDIDVKGKRVLLRVDFNVPITENSGVISDDSRIRASLPTIKYLVDHKAKVIICSHVGRPAGKVVENLRMAPTARRLSELMGLPVSMASDCIGQEVESKIGALKEGDVLILENLRFHPEEEANDADFAQKLARLADIYVDDAFSTAHRNHASIVGVAKYLPAVAGLLMEKELKVMGKLLHNPERPWACLIGGAKGSDKIGLLQNMLKKVDMLLVGGGMAATFLKAQGYEVGHSLVDDDQLDLARKLLQEAKDWKVPFLLPVDALVAQEIKAGASTRVVPTTSIPAGSHIVDIGPQSIELFCSKLGRCRTIIWNGPMGICEIPQFAQGTRSIARFLSTRNATTIIGGGSSAEVVQAMGLADKMTHVSTGGGASLKFLEGITLPGVEVLLDKK